MTKENVDKIIEILGNMDSVEKILEVCEICKDESLIKKMQNALRFGEEQALLETVGQLREVIHSKIPPELREYYYIQTINRDVATILLDDEQRKKAEELYRDKIEEIISLDEDERIKLSREIHAQQEKLKILKSLSDEKKVEVLDELDEKTRYSVILEMTDDNALLKALDKIGDEYKSSIAVKIKSSEKKLQLLDKIELGRLEIVQTIDDPEIQLQALNKLSKSEKTYFAIHTDNVTVKLMMLDYLEEQDKVSVAKSINDPTQKLKILDQLQGAKKLEVALSIDDPIVMLQARDMFDGEEKDEVIDRIKEIITTQNPEESILRRIYDRNPKNNTVANMPEMIETIDYRILGKQYIDTLGEEKVSVIAMGKSVQKQILGLDSKRYELFYKCIDNYIQSAGPEDWRAIAQTILEHMKTGEYDELIDSIEDLEKVDLTKLSIIMQNKNRYGIRTFEDIERYEEIVRTKCNEIIGTAGDIQEKKSAVFQKLFGQDFEYAQSMIELFETDIGNLPNSDEKDFILSLKAIMGVEDESVIRKIYEECEEIGLVNGMAIERKLKTVYAEKFNEGLYQPKEEDLIPQQDLEESLRDEELRVYDAGTNFKMIIHSIATIGTTKRSVKGSYKDDWNQPVSNAVPHICTSYIRNDMLGTVGANHFYYGFTRDEGRWVSLCW